VCRQSAAPVQPAWTWPTSRRSFRCLLGIGPVRVGHGSGRLLIQEAGGLVSDFTGGHDFLEKGHVVAGNTKCFKAVLTAIQPHLPASLKR